MLEVPADLMPAPGLGKDFDERIARTGMARIDRERPLEALQHSPAGERRARRLPRRERRLMLVTLALTRGMGLVLGLLLVAGALWRAAH